MRDTAGSAPALRCARRPQGTSPSPPARITLSRARGRAQAAPLPDAPPTQAARWRCAAAHPGPGCTPPGIEARGTGRVHPRADIRPPCERPGHPATTTRLPRRLAHTAPASSLASSLPSAAFSHWQIKSVHPFRPSAPHPPRPPFLSTP